MKRFILITGAIVYLFFIFICIAANAQSENPGPIMHIHAVQDFRGKVTVKDTSFRLDSSKMHGLVRHQVSRLKNYDFALADSATVKAKLHNRITHIHKRAHHLMNADSISIERKITVRGDSMIRDVRRIVYFKPSPSKNYIAADTVLSHNVTVHKGMKPDVSDITNTEELNDIGSGNMGTDIGTLNITDLNIYPNPSNGQFKVAFTLPDNSPVGLKITDMEGRTVWKDGVNNFTGRYNNNIDLSAQPKAVYMLEIMQNNKTMLKKLVVN